MPLICPASSIGSSLSRVSSSSPSSTPTDSESHGGGVGGQVHLSSSHSQAYSLGPLSSHHNSAGDHDSDELGGISSSGGSIGTGSGGGGGGGGIGGTNNGGVIPPLIASRPERTKSIVSRAISPLIMFELTLRENKTRLRLPREDLVAPVSPLKEGNPVYDLTRHQCLKNANFSNLHTNMARKKKLSSLIFFLKPKFSSSPRSPNFDLGRASGRKDEDQKKE